jgi:hypothetical protein
MPEDPGAFWEAVLSGDEDRVRAAIGALAPVERRRVLAHLRHMATDPDWSKAQRRNARCALRAMGEA